MGPSQINARRQIKGNVANVISAIADAVLPAGTPVAISRSTGHFIQADPSYKPAAFVVGLLTTQSATGFIATAEQSLLYLADWTAVTGQQLLAVGQTYFLGPSATLTTAPLSSPNCLVNVGEAVDANTMQLSLQPPVQL